MSKALLIKQFGEAVDTLGKWFPQEAAKLAKHREAIVDHIVRGVEPASDSPLARMKHESIPEAAVKVAETLPGLTPCEKATGVAGVDVMFFALGLAGLHVSNQERIARAIIRQLGGKTLRGLAAAIWNFSKAQGALNKAKALFAILGGIYNAGGFRAVFKVLKDEMSCWEWVKTSVIAVLQITSWFATDGIAFIAEAALSIMSAEQLIEDAAKAVKICFDS